MLLILVVAESEEAGKIFAFDNGLQNFSTTIVTKANHLSNYVPNTPVLFTPKWKQNRDREKIRAALLAGPLKYWS